MANKHIFKSLKYPICNNEFKAWCLTNDVYSYVYKTVLNSPRPFDVTLRDGIQNVPKDQIHNFDLKKKYALLNYIGLKYNPSAIELGSLVSKKVLPIMDNSAELFTLVNKNCDLFTTDKYLLVPSKNKLNDALQIKCSNISLITSVSNDFTLKNTKKTLLEVKNEIFETVYEMVSSHRIYIPKIKLYISCIDECPIAGKMNLDYIIKEIYFYYKVCHLDFLCLSDTCGTLELSKLKYIVNGLKSLNVDLTKISLHLHTNLKNENETLKIIHYALENDITNFDVSFLNSGGCSVTMKDNINANLSYELYYKALTQYIEKVASTYLE